MVIDIHAYAETLPEHRPDSAAATAFAQTCGLDMVMVTSAAAVATDGPPTDETAANVGTLSLCGESPYLCPLYWAHPGHLDSHVHAFGGAMESEPFAGAAFTPHFDAADPDGDLGRYGPYVAVLGNLGLPALFDVGTDAVFTIERVLALARRHPRVAFILCGAGRDHTWAGAVHEVHKVVRRGDARVLLDTAHARIDGIVDALSQIGPDHLVFGTGNTLPDEKQAQRCRARLDELSSRLASDVYTKLTSGNAQRLFRLAERSQT